MPTKPQAIVTDQRERGTVNQAKPIKFTKYLCLKL